MTRSADLRSPVFATEADVMRAIWTMVTPYSGRIGVAMICAAVGASLFVPVALATGNLADAALAGDTDVAMFWAAIILAAAAGVVLLDALSNVLAHAVAGQVQSDLRRETSERLQVVALGAFHRFSPEYLRALVIEDVETLEDGIAHLPPQLAAAYAGPLVMLLTMMVLDWRLTLAVILPVAIGAVVMARVLAQSGEATTQLHAAQTEMLVSMSDILKALPVVKTYNNADVALTRAYRAMDQFDRVVHDWERASLPPSNLFFVMIGSTLTVLSPVSIWLLHRGGVSLGDVVFFHAGAVSLSLVLATMFGLAARMRHQSRVIARRGEFMACPVLAFPKADTRQRGTAVGFENVSFSLDGQRILSNLSFSVREGQTLAIVGPSGAGKTTIARLLARFWDVDGGRITIGDADIRQMSAPQLARNLAFVFQDNFLFSRSVIDNLRVARPKASRDRIIAAARAAQAHRFIEELPGGYDTVLSPGMRLSVGQKQRLCIARALLHDAPVLVLDEAMAFVDPSNEWRVQQALEALGLGRTKIIIAHRLHTIREADQIIFVEHGQITEQGTHEDLLAMNGAYARQYRQYMQVQDFQLRAKTKSASP
ncbi:MAG: ABC transporter ATP-binding protein [Pseudomonadota bacterium]